MMVEAVMHRVVVLPGVAVAASPHHHAAVTLRAATLSRRADLPDQSGTLSNVARLYLQLQWRYRHQFRLRSTISAYHASRLTWSTSIPRNR